MIKTVIFDIGNVLMHFDYLPYARELLKEDLLVEKVTDAIFRSGYWAELDRGEPIEKIFPLMLAKEPEYQEQIRITIDNIGRCFRRAEYAIPWIRELKKQGFTVLYLSNYSEYDMHVNPEVLDFLPYMDGGIFSCYVHLLKPDRAIYQKICDECGLESGECVFIDDREENVLAAEEFGMKGIRFTTYPEVKKELDRFLKKDAKRGFVPEDERNFSTENLNTLQTASEHVYYLVNEGYDLKQASTFVGNHFLLSERQRLAITRSIATQEQLAERRKKQLDICELFGRTVRIDGFNTIITLEVMLNRSVLLECMDGTIRDLAALRGTYRLIPETSEAIRRMFDVLRQAGIKEAEILLDEPVSNSGRLKTLIAEIGEDYPFGLDIRILKNVDRELYEKDGVISSDSVVLDRCRSWFNLTEECLKHMDVPILRVWKESGREGALEEF